MTSKNNNINYIHNNRNHACASPVVKSTSLKTPVINIRRLNLHQATSCRITSDAMKDYKLFNRLRVVVSPLKFPVVRKINRSIFPKITKCMASRCLCCSFLHAKTNVVSSVNNRTFNCIIKENVT